MTRLPQQSSRLVGRFSPPTNRLAYTLLELVIVMSILASVAAVVWPRVSPLLRRSVHRDAALQVKADLAEARERAIRTGATQELRVYPDTGYYVVAATGATSPGLGLEPLDENMARPHQDRVPEVRGALPAELRELPDELVFAGHQAVDRDDPEIILAATGFGNQPDQGGFENRTGPPLEGASDFDTGAELAAKFFPDGRATEARIDLLRWDTRESLSIRVRGLTASVTIGPVEQFALPLDGMDPARSPGKDTKTSEDQR